MTAYHFDIPVRQGNHALTVILRQREYEDAPDFLNLAPDPDDLLPVEVYE